MKFKYQGYNRAAQLVKGEVEANSAQDAKAVLRTQLIRPTQLRLVTGTGSGPSLAEQANGLKLGSIDIGAMLKGSGAPKLEQFTAFIRQLATMQGAGIPIVQGLGVLAEQAENKRFGEVLADVQQKIQEGTNLTDAVKRHPKVFDRVFINLVAAGEVSGSLDKVLLRLATYYEKANSLRRKIIGAMTYPSLIVILVIALIIGLLGFVVPTFSELFMQNGKALPAPTQFLVDLSKWFTSNWYIVAGGLFGTGGGIYFCLTNPEVRKVLDPLLLEVPIFGDLIRKVGIARFSRTLGTMVQAGVPILEALAITANVAGNFAIEAAITRTRQSITQGNTIAEPLKAAGVFPPMAVSMIAIGEQSGALDEMLNKIAEFYEEEVDAKVSSLTSILEPLMIVTVGLVVAGVLIPMYLPIFQMGDVVGQ